MSDFAHRPTLRYDAAARMVAEAVRHARQHGCEIAVAVLDAAGHLLAYARMDDAPLPPMDASFERAEAALGRRPFTQKRSVSRRGRTVPCCPPPAAAQVAATETGNGGVPVVVDGLVAGAVGVDGALHEIDEAIARHAVRALVEADPTAS